MEHNNPAIFYRCCYASGGGIKNENMKNKADYSKYECPYSHLEKESGHELHGPEGYQDVYGVWCACGFRAPVFYLEPDELGLKLKKGTDVATCA